MKRSLSLFMIAAVAACSGGTVDANTAVSVALDSLPFPAVVAGDTLRDSNGVAAPVRAVAYSFEGTPLVGVPIKYLALDDGIDVTAGGIVTGGDTARPLASRVVGTLDGLQTSPRDLFVVPRPDALAAVAVADTIRYSVTDSTQNLGGALTVRLTAGTLPVRGWVVSFRISYPSDTLLASLIGDNSRASRVDTTDSDGRASRRVRVQPERFTAVNDSVVVLATARQRGAHVSGSPVRAVVTVRPRTP